MISKLGHYGIRGIPLNWFKSYLTKRRQFVEINNAQWETLFNKYGVLQGSVPGPLLFLIYINDLHNATNYSDIHHFADDTNLLYSRESLKDMNKKINFSFWSCIINSKFCFKIKMICIINSKFCFKIKMILVYNCCSFADLFFLR